MGRRGGKLWRADRCGLVRPLESFANLTYTLPSTPFQSKGAFSLTPTDKLATCLFQITGPAHVPYHDSRWQQLLLHYEKLVHLHNLGMPSPSSPPQSSINIDANGTSIAAAEFPLDGEDVVGNACRQCAKYSSTSSNLAALSLHVARMIRDLRQSIVDLTNGYANMQTKRDDGVDETQRLGGGTTKSKGSSTTKQRIELIGKARASCGALNILRLLSHETIVEACRQKESVNVEGQSSSYFQNNQHQQPLERDTSYILKESFTYRSRGNVPETGVQNDGQDAALELISAVMAFFATMGNLLHQRGDDSNHVDALSIPEVYDTVVQIMSLLLVLLSTQLYQPMVSSAQLADEGRTISDNYFLDKLMEYSHWQRRNSRQSMKRHDGRGMDSLDGLPATSVDNETLLLLFSCLSWLESRPAPPRRSIASHYVELTNSIAQQVPNMKIGGDGMYESHSIVMARVPVESTKATATAVARSTPLAAAASFSSSPLDLGQPTSSTSIVLGSDDTVALSSAGHVSGDVTTWNSSSILLLPIRSILLLSSSLFLLPIRLVRLAFRVLGHGRYRALLGVGSRSSSGISDIGESDHSILQNLQARCETNSGWNRTNNVLWLTDSPIADLGCALVLLLSNNCRTHLASGGRESKMHPFRGELASLNDNRWDRRSSQGATDYSLFPTDTNGVDLQTGLTKQATMTVVSINFESLFEAFGRIVHTEVGALMLYTMLLSSPILAASIAARSDLDTLVIPLLRTLYFSSTLSNDDATNLRRTNTASHLNPFVALSQRDRPFRSLSQLYVILILLLIFSQDASFGRDSFRRVNISGVKWYKERQIKEASLGSMLVLVLLRAISFNLNRLRDEFLLSNCCAVLLNLSPHIVDLNGYASTRLVSVTTSCFKRYSALVAENGGEVEEEGDMSTLLGMHGEVLGRCLSCLLFLLLYSIAHPSPFFRHAELCCS